MFRRNAPQTIEHKGVDPVTGEPFLRRYWLPVCGGHVRVDDHPLLLSPGLLGRRVVGSDGSYWWAMDLDELAALIKREWTVEVSNG